MPKPPPQDEQFVLFLSGKRLAPMGKAVCHYLEIMIYLCGYMVGICHCKMHVLRLFGLIDMCYCTGGFGTTIRFLIWI
jgi:hypothetical protein